MFCREANRTLIFLNAKNLESVLLSEPTCCGHVSCRTLTHSAKVCCRTFQIAEPKVLSFEKDSLAKPWNVGPLRIYPVLFFLRFVELQAFASKRSMTRTLSGKQDASQSVPRRPRVAELSSGPYIMPILQRDKGWGGSRGSFFKERKDGVEVGDSCSDPCSEVQESSQT